MRLKTPLQRALDALSLSSIRQFKARLKSSLNVSTGENCKPRTQQVWEILQLALRRKFAPEEYFLYRFYERRMSYPDMLNYLSNSDLRDKIRPTLNDSQWKCVLDNKWLFHRHYAAAGVPLPAMYGYFDTAAGLSFSGAMLRSAQDLQRLLWELKPPSMVMKPVGGIQGRALLILSRIEYADGEIRATSINGKPIGFSDMLSYLSSDHGVRYEMHAGHFVDLPGYIIEERLEQHPFFAELNPYTTNSIRVVTFLGKSGTVEIEFAGLRLGRKGGIADNWAQGGISVGVDPISGRLGRGVLKPKLGSEWLDRHPDTQVPFANRVIPRWRETLEACEHAALVSPHVHSIGWDVVVTPRGPKIIEGNPDWDLLMVQAHTAGYLQPDKRNKLAQFGLSFESDRLPAFDPRGVLTLLRFG